MSGGTFDYQQFRLQDIAERIQEEINHNYIRPEWCSADDWDGQKWTDETIAEFRKAIKLLYQAQVYAQRIDWLLSGDDSEETFHEMLKENLKELEQKLHLTVSGKEVYKICPRCKSRMIRDESNVYISMPPQYGYECPKCGDREFDTMKYENPEMEEQQPTEWSGKDSSMLCDIVGYITGTGSSSGITKQERVDFLYGLPKRFNLQSEQEWSEEDRRMLNVAIKSCEQTIEDYPRDKVRFKDCIAWLKSLRPQPKQEWSEEDEEMFDEALAGVLLARNRMNDTGCIGLAERFEKAYKWLESFRPRPHWKPSKEQMRALWEIYQGGEAQAPIASLYEDLKKL